MRAVRFSLATLLVLAIACGPELAAIYHFNLGLVLQETGLLDDAIAEYRKAIELDPNVAGTHNNLGLALAAKGQYDDAIAEYRIAIDLDPNYATAKANLEKALRLQESRNREH